MRKTIAGLYILTALTACAGNDLLVQRQTSMEGRLEQVMQGQNNNKSDLAGISAGILAQKELVARQAAAIKELQASHDALQDRVRMLTRRLEQLESPPKQNSPIELVNQENIAEGRDESVQAAYMKAFGLFSANSYRAAADAFSDFISSYPESEYAANARFWLGECYYSEGRYQEAIEAFTRVLEMSPSEKRASDSILKIGLSQYAINNPSKGATTLKLLLEKYPLSEAATKAKEQLGRSKE